MNKIKNRKHIILKDFISSFITRPVPTRKAMIA